jgi:L-lactate dehydrogenase complex protein LldE
MSASSPNVGLFVTCLVDLMRPSVGWAAVALLEAAGCTVSVPVAQTCCGQPAYNSGDRATTRDLAGRVIDAFGEFDYVVVPSGSCAAMIKLHYPALFPDDPVLAARAASLAERTFELMCFLREFRQVTEIKPEFHGTATYHDSCSGLRELAIKEQPRTLLQVVSGLQLKEHDSAETCCGFGGAFCAKYPEISAHMTDAKAAEIEATGADIVLGGDLGCLLNLAGRLKQRGASVTVRHVAEVLAGMTEVPPIGVKRG